MSRRKFSRALKRAICIEYMQSGMQRKEIALKYNLPSVNTLSSWINSCLSPLEIQEKCVNLPRQTETIGEDMAKDTSCTAENLPMIEALEKQVKQLEAKLKKEQDRNLALNTLIDIAEERGIKIRKKSGAKQ